MQSTCSTSYLLFQFLTAVALGDALGVPVQFEEREKLLESSVDTMLSHQAFDVPKGTWSDDTSLSIASLVSLSLGFNLNDLMTRYSQSIYRNNPSLSPQPSSFRNFNQRYYQGHSKSQQKCDVTGDSGFLRQPSTQIKSSAYVVDTLNSVFWCLFNSEQYFGAVKRAVNLGHDIDTIGSITSMLASLIYAPVTFPPNWLKDLKGRGQICRHQPSDN